MRKLLIILLLLVLIVGVISIYFYKAILSPNISLKGQQNKLLIHVPSESNYSDLKKILSDNNILNDENSFDMVAKMMNFSNVRPGQYTILNNWSNRELISVLRSGKQTPINLAFNNIRTIEDLAGFFSHKLEPDSLTILNYFLSDKVLEQNDKSKEDIMTLFIPNTYQFYWNYSPQKLLDRMVDEHDQFYNNDREKRLKELNLSPSQVYTLASIVQKETLVSSEKPRVAGVYINRLKRGQLLQADPTVVFASGNFGLRRVLNKHLTIDSPYNTYKYEGLPPGPIAMPDISTIDAVLNYEKHSYLYFCASPDNSGKHVFAKTLVQHNRNADNYRSYLNKRKIYK